MKKLFKTVLGCIMIAALVMPNIGAVQAEENTPGQVGGNDETIVKSEKPTLDEIELSTSGTTNNTGVPQAKIGEEFSVSVIIPGRAMGDDISYSPLTPYYDFEWNYSDSLTLVDNGAAPSYATFIGSKTGAVDISVKVIDKENVQNTKTFSITINVMPKKAVSPAVNPLANTKEPLKTDYLIDTINSGSNFYARLDPAVTPEIAKEVFAAAKEIGTDLVFSSEKDNGSQAMFSFAASDLIYTDINFNPDFSVDVENKDVKAIVPASAKPLIIDFAHNGNLPGKATVTIRLNEDQANLYKDIEELYLYHIDNENGKLVYSGVATITSGNFLTFEITHCSQYALTAEKLTDAQTVLPKAGLDDAPNTGV